PCFTVWKNTGAAEEGYVTGLEPATNFPNFKAFERRQGRVRTLPPGGRWECRWSLEVADTGPAVAALLAEVATLQAAPPAATRPPPQPLYRPTEPPGPVPQETGDPRGDSVPAALLPGKGVRPS